MSSDATSTVAPPSRRTPLLTVVRDRPLRVALAGNPNCGKTSIFNALTGARQHVANYPGVTVERRSGQCEISCGRAEIIDLPAGGLAPGARPRADPHGRPRSSS